MGCEVLYVTQEALAKEVSTAICAASGLKNRGAKKRTDLKFLNATDEPSVLLEVCFVDSQADVDLYRASFNQICAAIAESLSGIPVNAIPPETVPPPETVTDLPVVTIMYATGSVKIVTKPQ
jgi:N-acetylmuramoyl-L-alanine amidase